MLPQPMAGHGAILFPVPGMVRLRHWHPAQAVVPPPPGDVDVWTIALDAPASGEDFLLGLRPDEVQRACRLRFDVDRQRFVVSRAILRQILGRYLGVAPLELCLCTGPWGKPLLDSAHHGNRLRFNLSHSGELALVAISADREVGADLERIRSVPEAEGIAAHHLSPHERTSLAALPAPRRARAFLACWTLKEAYLKACGDGLNRRLDAFDMTVDDTASPRLLEVRDRPGDERFFRLARLELGKDYLAALAVENRSSTPAPSTHRDI